MPVRHRIELGDELAPPLPKRCRHCEESRSSCGSGGESQGAEGESWRVTLDHDLVETLSAIYPEWFKPQRSQPASPPDSAPRTPDDDQLSSWSADMDAAGTSSSASEPSSSPRVSPPKVVVDDSPLQPAMGKHKESLKVKLMMRRPINQLVAQGIMPPLKTPPAYFEQCKQLERAKTGDLLKAKIQRRPDRQELERRHILEQESHVDPSLAEKQRMLKKARLADQLNDQLSHRPGPLELIKKNILHTEENIETAVKSGVVAFKATCEGASSRPQHPAQYCGPPEDASPSPSPPQHPAPGKDKNRKKKHKHQPKARFKFHEYKGPPSAHKPASPPGDVETPYELLLQQQQMLLQLMVPSPSSPASPPGAAEPPPPPPPPPTHAARLQDMKVSDLRAECKRRNLRVSGPKPQLLDRLRPYLTDREEAPRSPAATVVIAASPLPTPAPVERDEDIVLSQRRQIEELERKLELSRQQLETVRREAAGAAASDQSRRLLQAHLVVTQLRAQLDALQQPQPAPPPPPAARIVLADTPERLVRLFAVSPPTNTSDDSASKQQQQPAYILNGVKVVPIAILPTHYEPPAPPSPPPPPPVPLHADDSQIMDDVLEILVENGELPASAVTSSDASVTNTSDIGDRSLDAGYSTAGDTIDTFSPPNVLDDAADELQRELAHIQNEILSHGDTDLGVDLLHDTFSTDYDRSNHSHDDFLSDLLEHHSDNHNEMDVTDDPPERMSITPLPNGDLLEPGRTCFDDMEDLSLPSFDNDDRHLDLKEFGIELDSDMNVDTDAFECKDTPLIPNLFGRGHVPQCDPLLGGVLAPPPRPATKHYSWDKIEFDAT